MLVEKADAKQHLRLTVADGHPLDGELDQKLAAAEAAIVDYVSRNEPGKTLVTAWTTPATTPPNVQAAVLLVLGELWRFHGDDPGAASSMPARDPSMDFQPAVLGLLRRFTDPVLA
jgi:hypothetical protein